MTEPPLLYRWVAHAGPVRSVGSVVTPARVLIVSGGDDGAVRRWDAATGDPVGEGLLGHRGAVLSVASMTLAGGRVLIISGGADGSVRRWNAVSGQSMGDPLTGHDGAVLSVALVELVGGRVLVVSGGVDGSVRRWDAVSGRSVGEPLVGYADAAPSSGSASQSVGEPLTHRREPVRSVTSATLPEGRALIVAGGDDRKLRQWDAESGRPEGEPLYSPDAFTCLASTVLPNGDRLAVSGDDAGVVRRWKLGTAAGPVGPPLANPGPAVSSLALATLSETLVMVVSGFTDGSVRRWNADSDVPIGQPLTGQSSSVLSVDLVVLPIDGGARILTGDSDGYITMWGALDADSHRWRTDAPAAIDTAEVNDELNREVLAAHLDVLVARIVAEEPSGTAVLLLDGRWGAGKTTVLNLLIRRWKAASVPPVVVAYDAWRESAVGPEWWSLATAMNRRVREHRGLLIQAAMSADSLWQRLHRSPSAMWAIVIAFLAVAAVRLGFWSDAAALGTTVAALAGIAAFALSAARALFWTSPAFGRLYVKTEDNPLGEIAELVGSLRRWTPRAMGSQAPCYALLVWFMPITILLAIGVAAVVTDLREIATLFALTAVAFIAIAVVAYAPLTRPFSMEHEKCPLVLVIDDLDRCASERVVRLIEAIHTLLRTTVPKSPFGRHGPASLVVIVLADSRWLRASFEASFTDFEKLSSAVHGLGADFLQKVFGHTVLIPELSAQQVETMIGIATMPGSPTAAVDSSHHPSPGVVPALTNAAAAASRRADEAIATSAPGDLRSEFVEQALADDELSVEARRTLELRRVLREGSEEGAAAAREHLLREYAGLMPANPRLIKRVANTHGMLLAVSSHLGQPREPDAVCRVAIMFVRFPVLVDALLSAVEVPKIDKDPEAQEVWLRADVQRLLTGADGNHVDLIEIARCFGREFSTAPGSPRSTEA